MEIKLELVGGSSTEFVLTNVTGIFETTSSNSQTSFSIEQRINLNTYSQAESTNIEELYPTISEQIDSGNYEKINIKIGSLTFVTLKITESEFKIVNFEKNIDNQMNTSMTAITSRLVLNNFIKE